MYNVKQNHLYLYREVNLSWSFMSSIVQSISVIYGMVISRGVINDIITVTQHKSPKSIMQCYALRIEFPM
jgi:hypothetical protein